MDLSSLPHKLGGRDQPSGEALCSTFNFLLKKTKNVRGETYFLRSLAFIFMSGITNEVIGHNILMLWEYRYQGVIDVMSLPWVVVLGWLFFGLIFLTTIRVYEDDVEKLFKTLIRKLQRIC